MTQRQKVPITMRALIQRINRKLRDDDTMLKITRGERWRHDLGDCYVVNVAPKLARRQARRPRRTRARA